MSKVFEKPITSCVYITYIFSLAYILIHINMQTHRLKLSSGENRVLCGCLLHTTDRHVVYCVDMRSPTPHIYPCMHAYTNAHTHTQVQREAAYHVTARGQGAVIHMHTQTHTHTLAGAWGQRHTSGLHVIKVQAALDSRDKKNLPEDLALAPWIHKDPERGTWCRESQKSYNAFLKLFAISRAERCRYAYNESSYRLIVPWM